MLKKNVHERNDRLATNTRHLLLLMFMSLLVGSKCSDRARSQGMRTVSVLDDDDESHVLDVRPPQLLTGSGRGVKKKGPIVRERRAAEREILCEGMEALAAVQGKYAPVIRAILKSAWGAIPLSRSAGLLLLPCFAISHPFHTLA